MPQNSSIGITWELDEKFWLPKFDRQVESEILGVRSHNLSFIKLSRVFWLKKKKKKKMRFKKHCSKMVSPIFLM